KSGTERNGLRVGVDERPIGADQCRDQGDNQDDADNREDEHRDQIAPAEARLQAWRRLREQGYPPTNYREAVGSAGEAVADSLAVGKAQGCADLLAEAREHDFRFQEVALHVRCSVPPEVVFGHAVAHDPDRNGPTDGIRRPLLDELATIDVRQRQVDQDERRDPAPDKRIGRLAGTHVFDGDYVTTKWQE